MRLCVSAVLVLLLALTRAGADTSPALESEECSKLGKLRTITDRNEMVGRFNIIAGYANNDIARSFHKLIHSSWFDLSLTEDGLYAEEYCNVNGTCLECRYNINVHGDTFKSSMAGISNEFKLHNFTKTLFIMDLHASMSNISALIQSLHLDPSLAHGQDNYAAHYYYLISREQEVSEAELQLFKDQAKCAGFTGEPDYRHNSDQGYCTEMESVIFNPDPECINLKKLDHITDKTQVVGHFYFMAIFTINDTLKKLAELSTSIWGEITANEAGLHVQEFNKMNGTCVEFNFDLTEGRHGNTATISEVLHESRLWSFTNNTWIIDVKLSTPNILPLLEKLHIDPSVTRGQSNFKGRGYYLISKVPEVNDADIQLFRKYANCAFFTEELNLHNKGHNDYCPKDGKMTVHFQ